MQIPLHPFIVHFPVALSFLAPVLILIITFMLKKNKITPKGWLIVVGLNLVITATGYIALESGETEEEIVQRVVEKESIHEHEEAAEIFVGASVVVLTLSIAAYFINPELQFFMHLGVAGLGLISCFLAFRASNLGGELVYEQGAASAYAQVIASPQEEPEGILPTPDEMTSESSSSDENESLKKDDNDYGNSEEIDEVEDEDSKEED